MPILRTLLGAAAVAVLLASAAWSQSGDGGVYTDIKTADGKTIGAASLTEGPGGVLMRLDVKGLPPGWHGMHFHEKGDCSDPKFMSTGGHMNMAGAKRPHGLLSEGGPDFGDLPNIYVHADGAAKAEVFSALVSLHGAGGRPALLDADGSALVIHAADDDQTSQPIGQAGARIACGEIK